MKIKFWGTRGSVPVPGKSTIKFGGNTSCIQVGDGNNLIIFDAGTGIRELGNHILQNTDCNDIHIFISHTHWDHIQGLPFFSPFYTEQCKLKIYAETRQGSSVSKVFETQWDPNYFPVTTDIFKEKVSYEDIGPKITTKINGFSISTINTHHSEGTLAFKIEKDGKKLVYMTDNELFYDAEHKSPSFEEILKMNKDQVDFIMGADVLIHDMMYEHEDYGNKIGWGHSNNFSASIFATLGKVKNLFMFHYDPDYNDSKIEHIERETNEYLKELKSSVVCKAAYDGLEIEI